MNLDAWLKSIRCVFLGPKIDVMASGDGARLVMLLESMLALLSLYELIRKRMDTGVAFTREYT